VKNLVLVLFILTIEAKNEGCRAACAVTGWTSGYFQSTNCYCVENKGPYEEFIYRHSRVGTRLNNNPELKPVSNFKATSGTNNYNFSGDYEQ
jgi:hypothetical protein